MNSPRRPQMPDHIRGALDAISRRLEPSRRLASIHVPLSPSPAPARIARRRGDWQMLSDGRSTGSVSRGRT